MSITLQDVTDQVNDYTGNYVTSTIDPGAKTRAINRAIEYLKRRLGFPSDETIQSFYFSEDQFFYPANTDFDEGLYLRYHDPSLNTQDREWRYMPYDDLLRRTGDASTTYLWSFTTINGLKQLVVVGQNLTRGSLIESFDNVGNWVASGDASALARSALQKYVGDASLSFTATRSSGTATITNSLESLGVQNYFETHAIFKFWTRLPNTSITNIILRLYVDNSNYWTITEDDLDDGTAFIANQWTKVGFPLDNAVATGSPAITSAVTKIEISYTLTAGFATGTIYTDHLFTAVPDYMDSTYYTRYKGKTTGGVDLINLATASDTLRIGDYFDDYLDVIARRAALNITPQLRGDKDFFQSYMEDFREMMKTLGKSFPRKRVQGAFKHYLKR